jgi:hypothetical protein
LCILCFCIVLCIFFPFIYSCLFLIFVHFYRPLPPGEKPIAGNITSYTYDTEISAYLSPGMARPLVADGRTASNMEGSCDILNKQSRTADNGLSSSLEIG